MFQDVFQRCFQAESICVSTTRAEIYVVLNSSAELLCLAHVYISVWKPCSCSSSLQWARSVAVSCEFFRHEAHCGARLFLVRALQVQEARRPWRCMVSHGVDSLRPGSRDSRTWLTTTASSKVVAEKGDCKSVESRDEVPARAAGGARGRGDVGSTVLCLSSPAIYFFRAAQKLLLIKCIRNSIWARCALFFLAWPLTSNSSEFVSTLSPRQKPMSTSVWNTSSRKPYTLTKSFNPTRCCLAALSQGHRITKLMNLISARAEPVEPFFQTRANRKHCELELKPC